jgi:hypothetical protein
MKVWVEDYGVNVDGNKGVEVEYYKLDKEDYRIIKEEPYKNFNNRLESEYFETYPLVPITNLVIEYEDIMINEETVNFIDMEIDKR